MNRSVYALLSKWARERYTTDLTHCYLLSIWTGECRYCEVELNVGGYLTRPSLDRIIPARGYKVGNVQWLCMRCNRRKDDMTSDDMKLMLAKQLDVEAGL